MTPNPSAPVAGLWTRALALCLAIFGPSACKPRVEDPRDVDPGAHLQQAANKASARVRLRELALPLYGVTVDNIGPLDDIVRTLKALERKPTVRIVFDETEGPDTYAEAVPRIHDTAFILGELLDSYHVKDLTLEQFKARTRAYVSAFGDKVDIWEVGNEANGEWLDDEKGPRTAVAKMTAAFDDIEAAGGRTALTLYYNEDCYKYKNHEMLPWARDDKNVPAHMKRGLDFVFVSYYEEDCNDLRPRWAPVFEELGRIFPNARLGFGEVGTRVEAKKADTLRRTYTWLNHSRFVGGYFWWYFVNDMVPPTKPLFGALNEAMKRIPPKQP